MLRAVRLSRNTNAREVVAESCLRMRAFQHASDTCAKQPRRYEFCLQSVCELTAARSTHRNVKAAKDMALDLIKQIQHNVAAKFEGVGSAVAKSLADCIEPVLEAVQEMRDMRTEREEVVMPYVKPVRRVLGTRWVKHELGDKRVKWVQEEDYCYDIPVERTLQTLLLNDEPAAHDILSFLDRLKAAKESTTGNLSDTVDGQGLQQHAIMMQIGDGHAYPLLFKLYGDGVKIANPIGVFRNNSDLFLTFWALENFRPNKRLSLRRIQLAGICFYDDLKRYGPRTVICGPSSDGSPSTSFGATMVRFNEAPQTFYVPHPMSYAARPADEPAFFEMASQGWCLTLGGALSNRMSPLTDRLLTVSVPFARA